MTEIRAPITGNVWKILAGEGDEVQPGDMVAVIESMKLEIPVESDEAGMVRQVIAVEGDVVAEGDAMFVLDESPDG